MSDLRAPRLAGRCLYEYEAHTVVGVLLGLYRPVGR
jgi:hypothetical protein